MGPTGTVVSFPDGGPAQYFQIQAMTVHNNRNFNLF